MNFISENLKTLLVTGFSFFILMAAQGQDPILEKLMSIVPQFPAEAIAEYDLIEGEIVRQGLFAHRRPMMFHLRI